MFAEYRRFGEGTLVDNLPNDIGELSLDETETSGFRPQYLVGGMRKRKTDVSDEYTSSKRRRQVGKTGNGYVDVSPYSSERCAEFFEVYADVKGAIDPHGIEKLCNDLEVEPTHIVMLVLAWKLKAKTMCVFRKEEWMQGMEQLQCDCLAKLKAKLPFLESLLSESSLFKQIFRYSFDFAREEGQRSLDKATASEMIRMLLVGRWSEVNVFLRYLEKSPYRVVNRDQWNNILEFAQTIRPDCSNYDEDGAWPVFLDDYVIWRREQLDVDGQTTDTPMLEGGDGSHL